MTRRQKRATFFPKTETFDGPDATDLNQKFFEIMAREVVFWVAAVVPPNEPRLIFVDIFVGLNGVFGSSIMEYHGKMSFV